MPPCSSLREIGTAHAVILSGMSDKDSIFFTIGCLFKLLSTYISCVDVPNTSHDAYY